MIRISDGIVLEDREMAFTPDYSSATVKQMFDASGPYAHVARASNVPPAFVMGTAVNAPPEKPMNIDWPDAVRVDELRLLQHPRAAEKHAAAARRRFEQRRKTGP